MLAPLLAVMLCSSVGGKLPSDAPAAHDAFWITSAPRHAGFLKPAMVLTAEQLENAPVEELSMRQLLAEDTRLSSPPTILPAALMLGIGGGVFLGAGILTYACFNSATRATGLDGLGWIFLGLLTGIVTIGGGVVAIVGGVLLPTKLSQRDAYARRQAQVQERMAMIRSGQAQEPPQALLPEGVPMAEGPAQSEVLRLEDTKPGLGLPIGLMSGGAAALAAGAYYWLNLRSFTGSSTPSGSALVLPIGLVVAGIAMEGLGTFFLISRLQTRSEIDDQIRDVQQNGPQGPEPMTPPPAPPLPGDGPMPPPPPPPSASAVPALPLFVSWGWSF